MKIIVCQPPLQSEKGCPTLGQNRQFQYFSEPTYIYPVVPAIAATLLKTKGFDVIWLDCIAEHISLEQFIRIIKNEKPDIIAMETKTPVIQYQWKLIDAIKDLTFDNWDLKIVLFGDHVTALPEESLNNSKVDFILTGGDYDFLLLNLCQSLKDLKSHNKSSEFRSRLEPGIWYKENNNINTSGNFHLNHDLNSLPFIDRDLTKWELYAYESGNYCRRPGTYIISGRDCWWGKCTFCSWPQLYPKFRTRSVNNVLEEIEQLVSNYNVKEIMDDTGTFPVGEWLVDFCNGIIKRGINKKINLDCNMRFDTLDFETYKLMKKAGFRFLLFGLESANQATLDKVNKNIKADRIIQSCINARKAGLYPHITLMFGYPWESYEDAKKTMELGKWLLKKDYAYTMQATIVIPYPNTPLFKLCRENNWLYSLDWSNYDMKDPIMKLSFPPEKLNQLVQSMYSVTFSPEFILRKIISIKSIDDIRYFWWGFLKVIGHIVDFKKDKSCKCNYKKCT